MKCLILAAGYATRLYPLTENFPKPLLKVGEKTILDWLVDDIHRCGLVDEYVVISNHKYAHHFENWAKEKQQNITVVDDGTSSNETRLGAVRDIQFAIDALNLDDEMLVIAGDNVLDFSLTEFIRYAGKKNTSCIMRYYEASEQRLTKCGVVEIDESDRILTMAEKPAQPTTHWCCPPFYFYTREDATLLISTHQVRDLENIIDPIIILDKKEVLLNASIEEIADKLYFDYSNEKAENALYSEMIPGGCIQVLPNTEKKDSKVNIEALFNTVHQHKELIKGMF